MPSNKEILSDLDKNLLSEVERLAGLNFAPNQIAKRLDINKAAFLRLYADKESPVRDAYDRGILIMQDEKMTVLNEKMKKSMTALQEHNKKEAETRFEALKSEIFGI